MKDIFIFSIPCTTVVYQMSQPRLIIEASYIIRCYHRCIWPRRSRICCYVPAVKQSLLQVRYDPLNLEVLGVKGGDDIWWLKRL